MLFGFGLRTVHAADQDYQSHGMTSFYGTYEYPGTDPSLPGTGGDGDGENNGGGDDNQGGSENNTGDGNQTNDNESNSTGSNQPDHSPSYDAAGNEILPQTGDLDYANVRLIGLTLLLVLVLILGIHKKEHTPQ